LREEISAVLRGANSSRGDNVLLVLNTGGGTVTGYGLAAAQLVRLGQAGLKLTVCVEQVAASGGYMMACVADKIIASPFAVLGSIGVISEQPNVYERLKVGAFILSFFSFYPSFLSLCHPAFLSPSVWSLSLPPLLTYP
jgi:ClpP class serine protease